MQRHLQMQHGMMQPGPPPNMQAVPGQGMMGQQPGVVVMRGYPGHEDPDKRAMFGPPGAAMDEETLYQVGELCLFQNRVMRMFIAAIE